MPRCVLSSNQRAYRSRCSVHLTRDATDSPFASVPNVMSQSTQNPQLGEARDGSNLEMVSLDDDAVDESELGGGIEDSLMGENIYNDLGNPDPTWVHRTAILIVIRVLTLPYTPAPNRIRFACP